MHHFITFVRTRESIHNPSHFHLAFKHCLPHFILLIFLTLFSCNIEKLENWNVIFVSEIINAATL